MLPALQQRGRKLVLNLSIRGIPLRALAAIFAALTVLAPTSAQAADIYKYWAYFSADDGAFVAQAKGPGDTKPGNGSIEAYRFAAPADFNNPNLPRADLAVVTFDAVCAAAETSGGQKAVAVVVDFGVPEDASDGETPPQPTAACAVVHADASGLQTLQAAFPDLRTEKSSFGPALCAIDGYPATGCLGVLAEVGSPADGEPVEFAIAGAEDEAAASNEDDSSNTLMLGAIGAVVVLILGAGVARQRSRKNQA
ncbi:MAG TPA: SCO2322 family protein [Nocardioidaceae bacterium]|nr:SCO2322 family protein [Nocardioidaceae bacterium]